MPTTRTPITMSCNYDTQLHTEMVKITLNTGRGGEGSRGREGKRGEEREGGGKRVGEGGRGREGRRGGFRLTSLSTCTHISSWKKQRK